MRTIAWFVFVWGVILMAVGLESLITGEFRTNYFRVYTGYIATVSATILVVAGAILMLAPIGVRWKEKRETRWLRTTWGAGPAIEVAGDEAHLAKELIGMRVLIEASNAAFETVDAWVVDVRRDGADQPLLLLSEIDPTRRRLLGVSLRSPTTTFCKTKADPMSVNLIEVKTASWLSDPLLPDDWRHLGHGKMVVI